MSIHRRRLRQRLHRQPPSLQQGQQHECTQRHLNRLVECVPRLKVSASRSLQTDSSSPLNRTTLEQACLAFPHFIRASFLSRTGASSRCGGREPSKPPRGTSCPNSPSSPPSPLLRHDDGHAARRTAYLRAPSGSLRHGQARESRRGVVRVSLASPPPSRAAGEERGEMWGVERSKKRVAGGLLSSVGCLFVCLRGEKMLTSYMGRREGESSRRRGWPPNWAHRLRK